MRKITWGKSGLWVLCALLAGYGCSSSSTNGGNPSDAGEDGPGLDTSMSTSSSGGSSGGTGGGSSSSSGGGSSSTSGGSSSSSSAGGGSSSSSGSSSGTDGGGDAMAHDGGGDATSNACDGAMACTSASNCPAQTTVCITDSCESNCCATQNAATGTLCTDSGGRVCNGSGTCVQCNAVSDCPASTTTCKTNTCIANTCGATNAPTGTVCNDSGGLVCDGGGNCVQCNTDSDCLLINDAGTFSCVNHVCQ